MKKLLTFVLTLVLALSLSATAFAAENTFAPGNTAPQDTTVSFSVDPAYTVTIPATVELAKDADTGSYKQDAVIKAENVRLKEGEVIQVALASDFTLTAGTTDLPYTVTVGDAAAAIATGDTVATFATSAGEQTSTLHFAAENPTYAGDYADTVTFTISVVASTNG